MNTANCTIEINKMICEGDTRTNLFWSDTRCILYFVPYLWTNNFHKLNQMANKTITVQGTEIRLYKEKEEDFISLTDIGKKFNEQAGQLITSWLRNRNTVEFLGVWESMHNESFNSIGFDRIRNRTGLSTFILSVSEWTTSTNAIGIRAKAGRYGGTYAHKDIAFEFLSLSSPSVKKLDSEK